MGSQWNLIVIFSFTRVYSIFFFDITVIHKNWIGTEWQFLTREIMFYSRVYGLACRVKSVKGVEGQEKGKIKEKYMDDRSIARRVCKAEMQIQIGNVGSRVYRMSESLLFRDFTVQDIILEIQFTLDWKFFSSCFDIWPLQPRFLYFDFLVSLDN